MDMSTGSDMGIGMWVFLLVGIVGLLVVVKVLFTGSSGQDGKVAESPIKILQKRYATGETDKDEFEQMKKELER